MNKLNKLKLSYYGPKKEIAKAKKILGKIPNLTQMKEPEARLKIQDAIDEHNLKASVCINGNSVWNKKRILRNLDRIIKHSILGRDAGWVRVTDLLILPKENDSQKIILSKYFYEFLHLDCGSIAHYNIHGWIATYPTVDHLKKFFMQNEFGKRVLDDIPWWHSDARRIVEEIERKLFPFRAYLKTKQPLFLG